MRFRKWLLRALVDPLLPGRVPEDPYRARGIASILLFTFFSAGFVVFTEAPLIGSWALRIIFFAMLAVSYLLTRLGRFRAGGLLLALVLGVGGVLVLAHPGIAFSAWQVVVLRQLMVCLVLVYLVYNLRAAVVYALGFLGSALLGFAIWDVPFAVGQLIGSIIIPGLIFIYIVFVAREYTFIERLRVQRFFEENEARYRAIVEDQRDLICRWLPGTRQITFVNKAYCEYFQNGDKDLIGTDIMAVVQPQDRVMVERQIALITGDHPMVSGENRIVRRDGETRWINWTNHAILDPAGKIVEIQSVGRDITDSRIAQEYLLKSEARYRAIVEDQTELICRWLPNHTLTFVNGAYCRYLDMDYDDLVGTSVMGFIHPGDRMHVQQMVDQLSPQHPTISYEHRVQRRDGSIRWMEWTDRAIFGADGGITEYQSIGRDITDLKIIEQAELDQRRFAEVLRANAEVISSTLDLDEVLDRILQHIASAYPFVNASIMLIEDGVARVTRSTGHVDESYDLLIRSLRLRISDIPNLREMMQSGQPIVISDTYHTGMWVDIPAARWIRSSVGAPILLEDERIGFLQLNSDVPNVFNEKHAERLRAFAYQAAVAIRNARLYEAVRRHAEDMENQVKLRTAELELVSSRMQVIFDSTGEGIFYTEDEVIQYVNPAFCKMIGYAPDDLIGKRVESLRSIGSNTEALNLLRHAAEIIREVGTWRGELTMKRGDTSAFTAGLTITPIGDIDAAPSRAVAIVRDISQEKALDAQRSNLLAYASHELRTPITNLKTRLYLIRRRPETLHEHLGVLERVATRMQHLVETLLDASRLERGHVQLECEPLLVGDLIAEIVQVQMPEAAAREIELRVEPPTDVMLIDADVQRMTQVLTNLVSNALNYTPKGGMVTLGAKRTGAVALIYVVDTGIGIAPEHQPHIFEPFFRVASKVDGMGLGLSIVKQIVELHKGEISVQSELGKGSRFVIRLPLYLDTATASR
ncbi:MAG: PAS domain S-box protein [Anaerolineae bacterium]|nr:PAS domain S-box protein [Anaerolineae bacterium]NUQ06306.1 PAS domain S-box protein [Anaerolineae bacterium]